MMLLWFLLGIGLGIGLSCLGVCLFMNIQHNKKK